MNKVLAIAPYPYLPYFSGGQKLIANFFHWLGKETTLTVLSVPGNDPSFATTYRLIPFLKEKFSRYYDRSLVDKITAYVRENDIDTIIWEHPYYAWLAFRVRKRTGVRTIFHTHNIEYQRFRSMGRWWWPVLKGYEKRAFKKADGLLFITPEDKQFAIDTWKIPAEKCIDLPFGIEINKFPDDRMASKNRIAGTFRIDPAVTFIMFNGLLGYKPNLDALKTILDKINPILLAQENFQYKIIISGKGLPATWNGLKAYAEKNIIFSGFAADIETFYKAADIFLNPVQTGGGIKTKMVEAIAFGATVVATQSGAAGINRDLCGDKLVVVPDNDWKSFATAIIDHSGSSSVTPQGYYQAYYWENVVKRMLQDLSHLSS